MATEQRDVTALPIRIHRYGQDKRVWNIVTPWFTIAYGYTPFNHKRRGFSIYGR